MPRSGPLGEFDRQVLGAVADGSLTAHEIADRLDGSQLAAKGALGRLDRRGLVQDDGGRPPAFSLTADGEALRALLDAPKAA